MMPQVKQPAEQLVYAFDFAARLGAESLAAVQSVAVTPRGRVAAVTPLTVGAQALATREVRLRLDGGTDGELYLVQVRVTDTAGQLHELDAEFAVADLAWTVPDVATFYATLADFVDRFGIEHALRLTDEFGNGRIDKARIANALADAQAIADGYLAARYQVPVAAPVPPLLKLSVLDLANYRLHRSEPPAGIKADGERAIATLNALGKGTMQLGVATPVAPAADNADPVVFAPGRRRFDDDSLRGW